MSQPSSAKFDLSRGPQIQGSSTSYSLREVDILHNNEDLGDSAKTSANHPTNLWGDSKAKFDAEQDSYILERKIDHGHSKNFPMLDDAIQFIYKRIDEDLRGIKKIPRPTQEDIEKQWAFDEGIGELVRKEQALKKKTAHSSTHAPAAEQKYNANAVSRSILPVPTLPAHWNMSVVEYVMHSLTIPDFPNAVHGLAISDYDPALVSDYNGYMKDSRKFFHRYPGSTLAARMYLNNGILPFSFPLRSTFSWGALLKRGRLLTDPVEVQEFFFGIKPPSTFDYTLFKKLPAEIRLKIMEGALEARTLKLRFSENDDPEHTDFTQFDFRTTDPTPALLLAGKIFQEELTKGNHAPYQLIFDHESCKQKVYFNKSRDVVLFNRSSNCSQLRSLLLKLAPLCLSHLHNISIAIDITNEGNRWLIKGFKEQERVTQKMSPLGTFRRHQQHMDDVDNGVAFERTSPLLSLFRRLERVKFYSLVPKDIWKEAWIQIHSGRCYRRQGSRFCFPPTSSIRLEVVECGCGDSPGPGPGTVLAPVPHTLHAARKWKKKFEVTDEQRVKEAKEHNKEVRLQIAEESEQGRKLIEPSFLDEEQANLPVITCRYAHITDLSSGMFCLWDGEGERTWERDDSDHCCWLDHTGNRDWRDDRSDA